MNQRTVDQRTAGAAERSLPRSAGRAPRRPVPPGHGEAACRVRDVLNRVGDKWSLIVVYELSGGSKRFTELKRDIDGISQRMLTVTLRGLERDGLVGRTVHAVVPPRVDYRLTPLGETLLDTVYRFMDWTLDHVDEIERAREAYDARLPHDGAEGRRSH